MTVIPSKKIEDPVTTVYWIALKSDNSIIHAGVCEHENSMETGLDTLECYATQEQAEARLDALGVTHTDEDGNSVFFPET